MNGPRWGVDLTGSLLAVLGLLVATAVLSIPANALAQGPLQPPERAAMLWVYVGTYTGGDGPDKSQGIYLLDLDLQSGVLGTPRLAAEAVNPSFLAIHPNRKFLYAVNEVDQFQGRRGGGVSAFAIDSASGILSPINQQSSVGTGPCHLTVDRLGKNVLVANYGGGSVVSLPIDTDGRLRPHSSFIQHEGSGNEPGRQEGPHAHSINLDAEGRFAVVADLGLDRVFVYSFDAWHGKLEPNRPAFTKVAPAPAPVISLSIRTDGSVTSSTSLPVPLQPSPMTPAKEL